MSPQQAIEHFGSQKKLAIALGITQPSVALWVANGEIPETRQYQIEVATLGVLRADRPARHSLGELPEVPQQTAGTGRRSQYS